MNTLFLFAYTVIFWNPAALAFESPIPSSVAGIDLPNTHTVINADVLRGMAPRSTEDIEDLMNYGVTDVLIFKNEIKDEVKREKAWLKEAGVLSSRIHHIPFRWKGIASFKKACQQTIRALRVIRNVLDSGDDRRILFHCTVGEDRTGHLAALLELLYDPRLDLEKLFFNQMCENGYEAGNPNKPKKVVSTLREELTPLFFKMAALIQDGSITVENLEEAYNQACSWEPELEVDPSEYKCVASSKLK